MLSYMFIAPTGPEIVQYIHAYLLYILLYYYYYDSTITFSAKLSQHCLPRSQLLLLTVCQRYCSLKLWKAGGLCVVLCNQCSGRSIQTPPPALPDDFIVWKVVTTDCSQSKAWACWINASSGVQDYNPVKSSKWYFSAALLNRRCDDSG